MDVPYTLAIHSPSYVLVQNSWNWGVSGSANDGTFSGAVSLVRIKAACDLQKSYNPHGCALQPFGDTVLALKTLQSRQCENVSLLQGEA